MQQLLMHTLVRRFLARKLCIQQLQLLHQKKTWRIYYWWMLGMAQLQGYALDLLAWMAQWSMICIQLLPSLWATDPVVAGGAL